MTKKYYNVAGHCFSVSLAKSMEALFNNIESYKIFEIDATNDAPPVVYNICFKDDNDPAPDVNDKFVDLDWDDAIMHVNENTDNGTHISNILASGVKAMEIHINQEFTHAEVWTSGNVYDRQFGMDNAMMLMYCFATSSLQTLMMHSSVIELDGMAYCFLGKSGTGKSTHTRLWLENVPRCTLLNDDNPILRIHDDGIYIYGSPWSGKTPCYRNVKARLGGIVKLHQEPENKIVSVNPILAYSILMPSVSCMRWNKKMAADIHASIEKVVLNTPFYSLGCKPDKEAALMCSDKIK